MDMRSRVCYLLISVALLAVLLGLMLFLCSTPLRAEPADPRSGPAPQDLSVREGQESPDVQITVDEIVASGFDSPVQVTHAGDGSQRLFVVEKSGRIKIIKDGAVLPIPFLDLSDLVTDRSELGLLGLAFHPDYEDNGYLYVYYSRVQDWATAIARYRVSATNPDVADPDSALVLLFIGQPYSNHNGGQLSFGPHDGYLYIGMGDGGSGGDPQDNSQNINTLLGAMLRLDVDGGTPYAIPSDNPYVGREGRDEIWAIGLRNPWRFSFDRVMGDLYLGDVGQNLWEEIDYLPAGTQGGVNFGWRCREGAHDYRITDSCLTAQFTDPIAEYSHTEGRSVTGGFVYRGASYPAMVGRYFYGDYVEGKIWSLYQTGSNPATWSEPELELDTDLNISAFGEDEHGELYVADFGGTIRRLADTSGSAPNLSSSRKKASSATADPGDVVTYTIQLINTGRLGDSTILLTDTIPRGLSYIPGSLRASHGTWDDQLQPVLHWEGTLDISRYVTITYRVKATGEVTGSVVNQAMVGGVSVPLFVLPESVFVPKSVLVTTRQDFFFPGTQPEHLNVGIPPSVDCDICHDSPIYDRWRGSMMSQAGRDPLMWAALSVANVDAPAAGDYCLRCHTPQGWLEGRSNPADGSALRPTDVGNGVACGLCHRLVDPVPSTSDEAAAIDLSVRAALTAPVPMDYVGSGALIADPDDNRRGPFSFDQELLYHTAFQTDFLRQTGDAVTRARLCGTCHNVDNPVLTWDQSRGQYWPNAPDAEAPVFAGDQLFPVERTFDEWLNSAYARGGVFAPQFAGSKPDGIVRTCQDCHLPRIVGAAADEAFTPVVRDCQTTGCLPEHVMVGGNTWVPQLLQDPDWRLSAEGEGAYLHETMLQAQTMLRKAASVTATLTSSGTAKIATVRVTNHTGHKLPTGYPEGRQLWINLRAFSADGQLVYESGAYDPATGQLRRDPEIKVYEVKQGITPELAALLGQPAGESFHFVLNNTVLKDNRIPPRGYRQTSFDQPGLRPVGATYEDDQYWDDTAYLLPSETESIVVTLYYQTASREYVEFLWKNGGVDGLALDGLWQSLRSPLEIVAQAWAPISSIYLPLMLKEP